MTTEAQKKAQKKWNSNNKQKCYKNKLVYRLKIRMNKWLNNWSYTF